MILPVTLLAALALVAPTSTALSNTSQAAAATKQVTIKSVAGKTPFIAKVTLKGVDTKKLTYVKFKVLTKKGLSAAPISAKYSRSYLKSNGLITSKTKVSFTVYGLYQNYNNKVTVTYKVGKKVVVKKIRIRTTAFVDDVLSNPEVVVARNKNLALDYSYFAMKNLHRPEAPFIMDVDGRIRWVGMYSAMSPSVGATSCRFINGHFQLGSGTKLYTLGLDSSLTEVADYASQNVTGFHHNIDPGKSGSLVEVDRTGEVESTIYEIDSRGTILKTFDLAAMMEDYMTDNGDDPTNFVRHGADWFHNNAAVYWAANNTLVVSSRENFVIGFDYDTKVIKWILGDTNKEWYTYPSLQAKALTLADNDFAPIGQHAVSITPQNELLLFDNGLQSMNVPVGAATGESRTYSSVKRFSIDEAALTAHMVWNYDHGRTIYSPITSSVYQKGTSYLIDYAAGTNNVGAWNKHLTMQGLNSLEQTVFEYRFSAAIAPTYGWNSEIVPLEYQVFK